MDVGNETVKRRHGETRLINAATFPIVNVSNLVSARPTDSYISISEIPSPPIFSSLSLSLSHEIILSFS